MNLCMAIRFAAQDLWKWKAKRATTALISTLATVCAASLLAWGLAIGSGDVERHRLKSQPLACCLWIGNEHLKMDEKIDLKYLSDLDSKIESRLGEMKSEYQGSSPFRVMKIFLGTPDGGRAMQVRGRTIRLEPGEVDPICSHCEIYPPEDYAERKKLRSLSASAPRDQEERPPLPPDAEGVIVTPIILKLLGIESNETLPATLVAHINLARYTVPILGFIETDLPGGEMFLLPEEYQLQLVEDPDNEPVGRIATGPLDPEWKAVDEPDNERRYQKLREECDEALANLDIQQSRKDEPGGERRLILETRGKPRYSLHEWRSHVRELRRIYIDNAGGNGREFGNIVSLVSEEPILEVFFGPLNEDWPYLNTLLEEEQYEEASGQIRDLESKLGIQSRASWRVETTMDGTTKRMRVVATQTSPRTLSQWSKDIEEFRTLFRDLLGKDPGQPLAAVTPVVAMEDATVSSTESYAYQKAGLFFTNIDALGPAAEVCDEQLPKEMRPSREKIESLEAIKESTEATYNIIGAFQIAFLAMTCINVGVIFWMRAEMKRPEAGLMRIIGMGTGSLLRHLVIQAVLIWGVSMLIGLSLGWFGGYFCASAWYPTSVVEQALAFDPPLRLWTTIVLVAGGISLLFAGLATQNWIMKSPTELLNDPGVALPPSEVDNSGIRVGMKT